MVNFMNLSAYLEQLPRGGKKILALRLGVTPSYLSRLISGDRSITAERALQIEEATQGLVSRYELRPDLQWGSPLRPRASSQGSPRLAMGNKIPAEPPIGYPCNPSVIPSSAEVAP